jgi:hypothetical protein
MAHRKVMRNVSSSSGRAIPSMPTWYRAPMEGIHDRLVSSCIPVIPMWYTRSSATPTTSVRKVKATDRNWIVFSCSFGVSTMRAAPTTGRNTPSVSPQ